MSAGMWGWSSVLLVKQYIVSTTTGQKIKNSSESVSVIDSKDLFPFTSEATKKTWVTSWMPITLACWLACSLSFFLYLGIHIFQND
jgi:hypothetical protein